MSEIQILEERDVHIGRLRVGVIKHQHVQFNGVLSEPYEQEVHKYSDAVAVLPYDKETNKVLLIEQFRCGAAIAGRGIQLEVIAGCVDEGETSSYSGVREAKEEAGLTIQPDAMVKFTSVFNVAGGSPDVIDIYTASVNLSDCKDMGYHGLPEEGEDIRVRVMDYDDAYDLVLDGTIMQPAAVICILHIRDLMAESAKGNLDGL